MYFATTGNNNYQGVGAVAYETTLGTQDVAIGEDHLDAILSIMRVAMREGSKINDYTWMTLAQYDAYMSLMHAYNGQLAQCGTCHDVITLKVTDWIDAHGKCDSCGEVTFYYDF